VHLHDTLIALQIMLLESVLPNVQPGQVEQLYRTNMSDDEIREGLTWVLKRAPQIVNTLAKDWKREEEHEASLCRTKCKVENFLQVVSRRHISILTAHQA